MSLPCNFVGRKTTRPVRKVCAIALFLALACVSFADTATFNTLINNEARSATVTIVQAEGQPSVSLKDLIRQLGGQFKVASGSVQVSLAGATATITVGETQVASSRNEFTLQKPAREVDNDIVIAVNDIAGFFSYGFGLEVKSGPAAATATTPATAAPAAGKKPKVVLDPGHGGGDTGKTGASGAIEKNLDLTIAQRVAKILEPTCQAVLTRNDDKPLSINDRVSAANTALQGNLLVSIHAGASLSQAPSGFEVFCPPKDVAQTQLTDRSVALGRSLANTISQAVGTPVRGIRRAPCKVFRNLQMPGVLVEIGFLTNPAEEQLLNNPEYQEKLAQGIAAGITAYLTAGAQ